MLYGYMLHIAMWHICSQANSKIKWFGSQIMFKRKKNLSYTLFQTSHSKHSQECCTAICCTLLQKKSRLIFCLFIPCQHSLHCLIEESFQLYDICSSSSLRVKPSKYLRIMIPHKYAK